MNLFRAALAPIAEGRPFFGQVIVTGSHAASVAAVSGGEADIASIDCVTFGLLQQGRPELTDAVAVVAQTRMSPALPLIMNVELARTHLSTVRAALFATLQDPALVEPRKVLGLIGAKALNDVEYEELAVIERAAIASGYPALA
jgi:ABC-type phosphate/phosphonate transport system substrate-binding protein